MSTGARRSQLCGLQWRDVDLASGALTFARAVADGPDGIVVKATKTHRAYRVTVDASTLAVLRGHHERMKERAEFCGTAVLPPATTLNVYSHFVDTGDKVAADVLQKIMDEATAE